MLNLLPPSEKKFLSQERRRKLIMVLCFEFFVFLGCLLLSMLAVEFYLLGEIDTQKYAADQIQNEIESPDFLNSRNLILKYNRQLAVMDEFYKTRIPVERAIKEFLSVQRPEGLYFNTLLFQPQQNLNKVKVSIIGFSDTRDNLLLFKQNIEASPAIENIVFSAESWINQKDVNFNLTLEVNGKI